MVKNPHANVGDTGSISGLGRSPGEMNANPPQCAWRIPWTEEPGRPQCMGSQRVRHDRSHLHIGLTTIQTFELVLISHPSKVMLKILQARLH